MSLWNHPRLTAALCTVAVLGCAAAPAVFLAAADAASLGRVETVADPYVAPTPTADDYYILRQLAARSRNAETEREQRPAEVLTAPKMYIGASASLQSMQYADSAAAEAAENALRQLAETGAHIIKTYYCDNFEQVTAACPVPIVIAGGKKIPERDALEMAYRAVKEGAAGVDMGRNVLQADAPKAMLRAIRMVVHENATPEAAYHAYELWQKDVD